MGFRLPATVRAAMLAACLASPSAHAILQGAAVGAEPEIAGSTVAIVIQDTQHPGPDGKPGYYPSTGIVVAREWILTVKHALTEHTATQYLWQVRFSREISATAPTDRMQRIERRDVVYHPTLDLALVHVAGGMPFEYRPVRFVTSAARLRREMPLRAVLAGFGPARDVRGRNILNYVEEPIAGLVVRGNERWPDNVIPPGQGAFYLEVDQRDGRGSCSGDSGGPVFVHLVDGGLGLLGVIKGNASYTAVHPCLGYSYAVRVDHAVEWISRVTGQLYDPASMLLVDER